MSAGTMSEIEILNEVDLDSEPPCEFRHRVTVCSVHVTHRVMSCKEGANACTNGAVRRAELNRRDAADPCTAPGCTKTIGECWKVIEI